jgi:hypothetical protein
LIAAVRRVKAPLLDRFRSGLIEVRMASRALDLDLSHAAVR